MDRIRIAKTTHTRRRRHYRRQSNKFHKPDSVCKLCSRFEIMKFRPPDSTASLNGNSETLCLSRPPPCHLSASFYIYIYTHTDLCMYLSLSLYQVWDTGRSNPVCMYLSLSLSVVIRSLPFFALHFRHSLDLLQQTPLEARHEQTTSCRGKAQCLFVFQTGFL